MDMDIDEGRLFILYVNTKLLVCLLVCRPHACFVRICSTVEWNLDLGSERSTGRSIPIRLFMGCTAYICPAINTPHSPCPLLLFPS